MLTYSEAQTMMASAQDRGYGKRRKLANNTYLYERMGTDYAIRLHSTDIITLHADGTYTLNTGGWDTVTTKARLNDLGPARIYSYGKFGWCVFGKNDPKTAPKVQKCRKCHGTGMIHYDAVYRYWDYSNAYQPPGFAGPVRLDPPEMTLPAHDGDCSYCAGSGKQDYGSKPRPVRFYDGIRVDAYGETVDPTDERAYETPEEHTARMTAIERAHRDRRKIERQRFMSRYGLTPKRGRLIVFKAVDEAYHSGWDFHYPIGETVTDPDWRPTTSCGHGLHFGPTPHDAQSYFIDATRFLACEVKVSGMIVLDDKIKVESARVLYEVDINGNRI